MDISGEYVIPAARETVWQALNDPETLQACIPGCEELVKVSDTEFTAKVRTKIGAVSARFNGTVNLKDINPPESYTIAGQGQGGPAGFAKGDAHVVLKPDPGGTRLTYKAEAQVSGKLAAVGSRLVQGVAKKMADEFFTAFATKLGGAAAPALTARPAPPVARRRHGPPLWSWLVGGLTVALVLLFLWSVSQ